MNDTIKNEIADLIKIPSVLMCKDGSPIEYKGSFKKRKIKLRTINNISANLIYYTATHGGSMQELQKFSSGDFGQFLNVQKIYTN